MNKSQQLLSDIVVYNKYAKYIPSLKRRETWTEIVDRYLEMMIKYNDFKEKQPDSKFRLCWQVDRTVPKRT